MRKVGMAYSKSSKDGIFFTGKNDRVRVCKDVGFNIIELNLSRAIKTMAQANDSPGTGRWSIAGKIPSIPGIHSQPSEFK